MIPVARRLYELDNNIIVAAADDHLALFKNELPTLTYVNFPGFRPGYSRYFPQYLVLFCKIPVLIFWTIREHFRVRKLISGYNVDILISDNRFGLWNRSIKTVYVTHMPRIPFPRYAKFMEWTGILLHRYIINKYSLCLIPDLPGENNISGRLSHGLKFPGNVRYTGILSRFVYTYNSDIKDTYEFPYYTMVLSGPEPQRSILRKKAVDFLKNKYYKTVILEGKPSGTIEKTESDNFISYNHLPSAGMKDILTGSELIISRSGYTTVMELISLNCNALLIPTPGQTEQEYLAGYLEKKGWFVHVSQKNIRPGMEMPVKRPFPAVEILNESRELFEKAIEELLKEDDKQA